MAFLVAIPEAVTAAAQDLAGLASTLGAAQASAIPAITSILPAAADEVSAGIAGVFTQSAKEFRALSSQAAEFHEAFAQNLANTAAAYACADTQSASQLLANSAETVTYTFNLLDPLQFGEFVATLAGGEVYAFFSGPAGGFLVLPLEPILTLLLAIFPEFAFAALAILSGSGGVGGSG